MKNIPTPPATEILVKVRFTRPCRFRLLEGQVIEAAAGAEMELPKRSTEPLLHSKAITLLP